MIIQLKRLWQGVAILLLAILTLHPLNSYSQAVPSTFEEHVQKVCVKACADSDKILGIATDAALALELDVVDILAIMQVESEFKPKAINNTSVGLMQVNLRYHRKKFKTSVYDLRANTYIGAGIYKVCLDKYQGKKAKALRCYNGEGVKNMVYPNKVLKIIKQLQTLDLSVK